MSIFSELIGGGAGGVGDLVKKVVGTFKLSPEAKAEFDAKIAEHEFDLAKLDAEYQAKLIDRDVAIQKEASETIRAEATSEDPFVRRARPAFLWVMTTAIGISLIVFPLINACTGKGLVFIQIPDAYLQLFGVGFLGYTAARSYEKTSANKPSQ